MNNSGILNDIDDSGILNDIDDYRKILEDTDTTPNEKNKKIIEYLNENFLKDVNNKDNYKKYLE
jgi:hypothetical protein